MTEYTKAYIEDGASNNPVVRRCNVNIGQLSHQGVAIMYPEVSRNSGQVFYYWAFHEFDGGWFDPVDDSKPETPDNRLAVLTYETRPLFRFGPFDDYPSAVGHQESIIQEISGG